MRTATVVAYFIFAIVFLGSIGVSLPYVFECVKGTHSTTDLVQNLVTYFIALFFCSSLDLNLGIINKRKANMKFVMLSIWIINACMLIFTFYILYKNNRGESEKVINLAALGVVFSYIIWWVANYNNSNFDDNSYADEIKQTAIKAKEHLANKYQSE